MPPFPPQSQNGFVFTLPKIDCKAMFNLNLCSPILPPSCPPPLQRKKKKKILAEFNSVVTTKMMRERGTWVRIFTLAPL